MMTSSIGNIFRVTGPLCGEFTGHRWIPRTKASDAKLWCSLWYAPEYTIVRMVNLRRHRAHYDVIVMIKYKMIIHNDVIKWKHFPRYWPFVRGIHRSPVNSPHKGQWRKALMFSLICAWIYNCEAGEFETPSRPLWRHCNDKVQNDNTPG